MSKFNERVEQSSPCVYQCKHFFPVEDFGLYPARISFGYGESGTVSFGVRAVANDGSHVTARTGSRVVANSGSYVVAETGSFVVAELNSHVIAEAGSYVVAKSGSFVKAYPECTVEVKFGSSVSVYGGTIICSSGCSVSVYDMLCHIILKGAGCHIYSYIPVDFVFISASQSSFRPEIDVLYSPVDDIYFDEDCCDEDC